MIRALFELLITVLIVIVARVLLTSVMRGIANASASAFRRSSQPAPAGQAAGPPPATAGGDLHKDPVCGTYVAESTPFRQSISGQTYYYCSGACREKHVLVAH
jgi:hypothetical protein